MFSIFAAFVAIPVLAQSVFAGDCVRSYTIKEGDICDGISGANNVSTYQLAVINNGVINSACSDLTPGKSICLGYEGEDCSTTYVVKADDTCDGLSSVAGINSTMLFLNNPQIDAECGNLYIGEVLCVSKTVQVPPAPVNGLKPAVTIPATATPVITSSAAQPSASADDSDDDDLPWCDEL